MDEEVESERLSAISSEHEVEEMKEDDKRGTHTTLMGEVTKQKSMKPQKSMKTQQSMKPKKTLQEKLAIAT